MTIPQARLERVIGELCCLLPDLTADELMTARQLIAGLPGSRVFRYSDGDIARGTAWALRKTVPPMPTPSRASPAHPSNGARPPAFHLPGCACGWC